MYNFKISFDMYNAMIRNRKLEIENSRKQMKNATQESSKNVDDEADKPSFRKVGIKRKIDDYYTNKPSFNNLTTKWKTDDVETVKQKVTKFTTRKRKVDDDINVVKQTLNKTTQKKRKIDDDTAKESCRKKRKLMLAPKENGPSIVFFDDRDNRILDLPKTSRRSNITAPQYCEMIKYIRDTTGRRPRNIEDTTANGTPNDKIEANNTIDPLNVNADDKTDDGASNDAINDPFGGKIKCSNDETEAEDDATNEPLTDNIKDESSNENNEEYNTTNDRIEHFSLDNEGGMDTEISFRKDVSDVNESVAEENSDLADEGTSNAKIDD